MRGLDGSWDTEGAAGARRRRQRALGSAGGSAGGWRLLAWVTWVALAGCGEAPAVRPISAPRAEEATLARGERGDEKLDRRARGTEEISGTGAATAPRGTAVQDSPIRWVAIGDLHGDFDATRAAFRLAGAIDEADHWIGGDLVVVQCGDQLDRGDDEPEILAFLERVAGEAKQAGGAVHVLVGNHELMNALGDLRYVTKDGFVDYANVARDEASAARVAAMAADIPEEYRGRVLAFAPGGPEATRLADHPMVLAVGDTVFVHGGVEPVWARRGIDTLNRETSAFLRGEGPLPDAVTAQDGPLWSRKFASDDPSACADLETSLALLGVKRMVVGHTVQEGGITSGCDDRAWRVDVGLSRHYGGPIQVLSMQDGQLRVLNAAR